MKITGNIDNPRYFFVFCLHVMVKFNCVHFNSLRDHDYSIIPEQIISNSPWTFWKCRKIRKWKRRALLIVGHDTEKGQLPDVHLSIVQPQCPLLFMIGCNYRPDLSFAPRAALSA
jgi:hypothetical protein